MRDKYCKNCIFHHAAGHPPNHKYAKYNDWCIKLGNFAWKAVGHCKLQKFKKEKET